MVGTGADDLPAGAMVSEALRTLKREGSNVLLVGEHERGAHEAVCRRHLADGNGDDHYRVLVATGDDPPPRAGGPRTRVVRLAPSAPAGGTDDPSAVAPDELLSALGVRTIESIDAAEAEAGGLAPSQLRLCVDPLEALLSTYGRETVFRFLHVVTTRVKTARGMAHYHYRADRTSDAVRLLEPLFDAVVEVRERDGTEQRWHFRERKRSTDWLTP